MLFVLLSFFICVFVAQRLKLKLFFIYMLFIFTKALVLCLGEGSC